MFRKVDPNNCTCGSNASVKSEKPNGGKEIFWVKCERRSCWWGPERPSRAGAVNGWNKVMVEERKP